MATMVAKMSGSRSFMGRGFAETGAVILASKMAKGKRLASRAWSVVDCAE
jgi:hypothetical protein